MRKFFRPKITLISAVILIILLSVTIFQKRDSLASVFWQKNRPGAALFLVKNDAELAIKIGKFYFGGGSYDLKKAEKAYQKALLANPRVLWGHYELARIYLVRGNLAKALEEINKELEANPENLRSLYVRGLIQGHRGNLKQAEEDFYRFTKWAPKEWAGYNDLAWIKTKLADYTGAKETILEALSLIPDAENNPWLWNGLGVAELNLEDYKSAKKSFASAKKSAGTITTEEWRKAYPGNKPEQAEEGIRKFQKAIEKNLEIAMSKLSKK